MGLDVYVGPLTRYTLGEWLTIVQQAGLDMGVQVEIVRPGGPPAPDDVVTDPDEVRETANRWQRGLLDAIGGGEGWDDHEDLPYWTDKPDWDGYGGLVLLAAYDERPELRPGRGKGLLTRRRRDSARDFGDAPAYREAARDPSRYPTLLCGVEWWLPLPADAPTVFSAPRLTGQPTLMSGVDQLVTELRTLATRTGIDGQDELERIRRVGPPDRDAPVEAAGRFGLSVFLELALQAQRARQPLLLDY